MYSIGLGNRWSYCRYLLVGSYNHGCCIAILELVVETGWEQGQWKRHVNSQRHSWLSTPWHQLRRCYTLRRDITKAINSSIHLWLLCYILCNLLSQFCVRVASVCSLVTTTRIDQWILSLSLNALTTTLTIIVLLQNSSCHTLMHTTAKWSELQVAHYYTNTPRYCY